MVHEITPSTKQIMPSEQGYMLNVITNLMTSLQAQDTDSSVENRERCASIINKMNLMASEGTVA